MKHHPPAPLRPYYPPQPAGGGGGGRAPPQGLYTCPARKTKVAASAFTEYYQSNST
jgi:hypothetical protein